MKKCLSFSFHIWKNVYPTISIIEKKVFSTIFKNEKTLILEFFFTIFWFYEAK